MALKITCPHCSAPHRLDEPFPLPGAEVQCGSCGQPMSISYPQGLIERMRSRGVQFSDSKKKIDQGRKPTKKVKKKSESVSQASADSASKSSKDHSNLDTPPKEKKAPNRKVESLKKGKGEARQGKRSEKRTSDKSALKRRKKRPGFFQRLGPNIRFLLKLSLLGSFVLLLISMVAGVMAYKFYEKNLNKLDCILQKESHCQKFAEDSLCKLKEADLSESVCAELDSKTDANADHFEFLKEYEPATVTVIKDRNGVLMGEVFSERRYLRPLVQDCGTSRASKFKDCPTKAIPEMVQNAFIAAEDADFWNHKGVDYEGIARAGLAYIKSGKKKQGASTITQQVAKNSFLTPERSFDRKMREIILAGRLEKALDKNQILYLYLNEINLGSGSYGVEAASRVYFEKSVPELSIAEAAIIAGIPKAPKKYSPINNWKASRKRQVYVLEQMLLKGFIEQAEFDEAIAERVLVHIPDQNPLYKKNPYLRTWHPASRYYTEHILRYLKKTYGDNMILRDGLEVVTACDLEKQQAAQLSLIDGVQIADRKTGWRGPKKSIAAEQISKWREAQESEMRQKKVDHLLYVADIESGAGGSLPIPDSSSLEKMKWYEAIVVSVVKKHAIVGIGNHTAYLPLEWNTWTEKPNTDKRWKSRNQKDMRKALNVGDIVDVRIQYLTYEEAIETLSNSETAWNKSESKKRTKEANKLKNSHKKAAGLPIAKLMQKPNLEGALFSYRLQNSTEEVYDQGAVLAMVGGIDYENSEFNRVTQSERPVGSTFKPMVYAAAIKTRTYTPGTMLPDSQHVSQYSKWKPGNYDNKVKGNVSLRYALAVSRNIPTVRVIEQISNENVYQMAGPVQQIGYDKPLRTRELIDDYDGKAACVGTKSPSTIKGKSWCEDIKPESCSLINTDGAYLNGRYAPANFACLDAPFQKNGASWCHSCDVNLRVCKWYPLVEGNGCLDARMNSEGQILCRICDQSMSLGSSDLTIVELSRAYSVFGTYGDLIEPYYIEEVKYRDGTIIEFHKQIEQTEALDDGVASISNWLLTNVVTGGTANKARQALNRKKTKKQAGSTMSLAGKTGTTDDFKDAWFVGYNPDVLTTTWVGYDQPASMGGGMSGGDVALPIWIDYMKSIFPWEEESRTKKFPPLPSDKVHWITINEKNGLRASKGRSLPMLIGTEPQNIAVNEDQTGIETIDDEDY